ncbi:hypothetical protein PHYSODRAFT_499078 [Phytophthora sojae]|uniref:Uncharacterized protein n=1 Tax=Phytophthora sojae (strain P6497) TaxID=1094619 RepID=G4ZGS5_PHYSP|nr:hypothetical protein PHYSODRAFT_499078 [Phytophthora sojae]EGZ17574.1 hypothetical protein PHYSODRAFT_499078 [Phytophthora sojae]|eukprot:XP_009526632.1 hypothetical protein PHYSODRAFT_499078 [Phytophthora sojae]
MGAASVGPSVEEAKSARASVNRPSIWHRLGRRWSDLQIGRQGSYSVERLESLDNYCKTTSKTRAMMVCLLTPLPALSTAVLLECLPLRPPSEGWKANWMFWIRLSLMVFIICFVGISELLTFLPDLNFTLCKRLIVASGTSAGFMTVCLLVADTIGFPVPNTWQSAGVVEGVLVRTMILLVFGTKPFARNSRCRTWGSCCLSSEK